METYVRGFSFMPDNKVEVSDLQYIEGEELERAWKSTRRERVKQQEERIWEEFVKEQNIIDSVCKDDPYQFLDQMPESRLKEMLELELQKMRKEKIEEELNVINEEISRDDKNSPVSEEIENQHVVTFVESDKEECDVFHIFDDDKDDEISGPEDEILNESAGSPCTVRERIDDCKGVSPTLSRRNIDNKPSVQKSSENMSDIIQNSIYCAKVRELRIKINEEILLITSTLETQHLRSIDPEDLGKMRKRSAEFCSRFNRIYMYQLNRQIQDVVRNNNRELPFARHTHFQSQMIRIVSLHQNILQSLQVFNKSLSQTAYGPEGVEMLQALVQLLRESNITCQNTPAPKDFAAASDLYKDDILVTCDKLEEVIREYATRVIIAFDNADSNSTSRSKKSSEIGKKRPISIQSKPRLKADARLSMYSIDTLRTHNLKSTSSNNYRCGGANKIHGDGLHDSALKQDDKEKRNKKSPRSRRPLMRDPHEGKPRMRRPQRDLDPRTMVETFDTCTSSHISCEVSPRQTPKLCKEVTPRRKNKDSTPRRSQNATPRDVNNISPSPKVKSKSTSPRTLKNHQKAVLIEPQYDIDSKVEITPISIIQCSKKKRHEVTNDTKKDSSGTGTDAVPGSVRERVRERDDACTSEKKTDGDKHKSMVKGSSSCEVSTLLRKLCGGDGASGRSERVSGAKNAQLLCISGTNPKQPSTPQLLRILEETIQKKAPKPLFSEKSTFSVKDIDKYRLTFNLAEKSVQNMFQYRTKFVQHMLTSPMYANSVVGKPWEMIGSMSEQIIDELLLECAKEMELEEIVQEMYKNETH